MVVVIISMLLFFRNRATNAFQIMTGVFMSSSGASRRVIDTFNHMGLSVNYQWVIKIMESISHIYWCEQPRTVQTSLRNLSEDAKLHAQSFVKKSNRCWAVVYDNINFTLRKTSQRLDSATQQINATTSAVFSLPTNFSRKAYAAALSIAERNKLAGLRRLFKIDSLRPSKERHQEAATAFKHAIRIIILNNCPGKMRRRQPTKALRRHARNLKPKIWILSNEKTKFFPLPALNEEEASVGGTIRVVEKIFTSLLGLAVELIEVERWAAVVGWGLVDHPEFATHEGWTARRVQQVPAVWLGSRGRHAISFPTECHVYSLQDTSWDNRPAKSKLVGTSSKPSSTFQVGSKEAWI